MMANETKTVRIEIPANQGSSIHITSNDSGQTIVTIEQSIEDNDVIKIISSPSKNYDKRTARREHEGLGKTTTDFKMGLVETNSETNRQGHVYVTETRDIRKDGNESQIVESVETHSWLRESNYPDCVPFSSETLNIKKESNFSQVECNTSQIAPGHQMKADQSLDETNSLETNRPRTRNWTLSEIYKNKRVTRSAHYRDASRSPLSRDVRKIESNLSRDIVKCASRSPLSRDVRKVESHISRDIVKRASRSPLSKDERKDTSHLSRDERKVTSHISRDIVKCAPRSPLSRDERIFVPSSPLSKVYFKLKPREIKTEIPKPVIPTIYLCTTGRRVLRDRKKIKNASDVVNRSNMVETKSKNQGRECLKRNCHVINRKALRKANIGQSKPYLSFREIKDSSLEKQELRKHIVKRNEQIKSVKRSIVRLCRIKPAKNLNYILFKQRKVFVPNMNIIKQMNLNCRVLLKPIRVAANSKHLKYNSDLIEKLYSNLKTHEDFSNMNRFDNYVHKLVTVLSSEKPKQNSFLDKHTKKKGVHKAEALDANDEEDVAILFEEALQKGMCSQPWNTRTYKETKTELTKSYKESPQCFSDSSGSVLLDLRKKFDGVHVGQSNLIVECTKNESFEEPSQTHLLRPCFVLIGDESRAEFVQRARVLKYLELVPVHQKDIPPETNEQPLRPYLLPYAWELPLHIFEQLRKQKLIKKPKTVTRLLSQYSVIQRLSL